MPMIGHVHAERMTTGHHAGARRRTHGRTGVKPVEHHARLGHGIEVRRLDKRMAGKARVAVAMIVGHYQHNVGARLGRCQRQQTA